MKQREFVYRVTVEGALGWELRNQTLSEALVDEAEDAAELLHPGFHDLETDSTDISVEGDVLVVTFKWTESDEPRQPQRLKAVFDVVTRRAGYAVLTVPEGTNVERLLNDHLDKWGKTIIEEDLPEGVELHSFSLEQDSQDHQVEVNWTENPDA